MNKKSIIACLVVTALFVIAVTVALSVLYSGQGKETSSSLYDSKDYGLLAAVPADAVYVIKAQDLGTAMTTLSPASSMGALIGTKTRSGAFMTFLDSLSRASGVVSGQAVAISGHNIGTIAPLMIVDAGRAGEAASESVNAISGIAKDKGLFAKYIDVSDCTHNDCYLEKRSILLVSPSDILIQSSERHLKRSLSILDSEGVSESLSKVSGRNFMVFPNANINKIVSENVLRRHRSDANFLESLADCISFGITDCSDAGFSLAGAPATGITPQKFLNVFRDVNPSASKVSDVIPAYTVFAATLPLSDVASYHTSYMGFAETQSLATKLQEQRKQLFRSNGTDPVVWAKSLDFKEISVAVFKAGTSFEKVLLIKVGGNDEGLIFKGMSPEDIRAYDGGILPFPYKGFAPALFGKLFAIPDESSFIYKKGWLIIGSNKALEEYTSGRALEYTLSGYTADAGVENALSRKDVYFGAYYSASESPDMADSLFMKSFATSLKASSADVSYAPLFVTVGESRSGMNILVDLDRTVVTKSKAPVHERDTVVKVPDGPFRVKNSGTGKMNLFYQQKNLYLCLQEEGGKGLWAVPFSGPICGCAQTVDYFANGKLQILFASGTKLHLIDRLGRFVNPFPVDLGKEILIGPDVYDFSGKRKYNVMVLHKDNTIEMYNLQGKKPAEWKGIAPAETITAMPERVDVGAKTYWVVRTSLRTLIYGFYGGEPLTDFSGNKMIRKDSAVTPVEGGSVEVTCYDGKKHTIKL